MLKNILCIIAFFYIQGILGGLLGPNLRFDAEGNVLNKDVPMDFMKLVASKVKGEKDGKTKEVVEEVVPETGDPKEISKEDIHSENAKDELKILKKLHNRLLETKNSQEKADLRKLIMEKVEKIERLLHKNKKPSENGIENLLTEDKSKTEKDESKKSSENSEHTLNFKVEIDKKTGELLTNQKSSGETKTDDKSKGTETKTDDKSKASETKIEDKSKASENKTEDKSEESKTATDDKSSEEMGNNREIGETIVQVHKPSKESIDDEIVEMPGLSASDFMTKDSKESSGKKSGLRQTDNASADYLDTANAKEIILDPVSSKQTDDDGKMTGETIVQVHPPNKGSKDEKSTIDPLFEFYTDSMENKVDELNKKTKLATVKLVEATTKKTDEVTTEELEKEKTAKAPTTADPKVAYYPWESPVCEDKSDSCDSFKPMCSLFSIVAYRQCRKTCKVCYKDKPKHRILRTSLKSLSEKASITFTQTNPDAPTFMTACAKLVDKKNTYSAVIHSFGEVLQDGQRCESFGPHFNPFGAQHGRPQDSTKHVGDLGMLEFGETPDDWPEDIAICEKGQLGAFGMFDHINLFSELSPENHPIAIYDGEAPMHGFDDSHVVACGQLRRL